MVNVNVAVAVNAVASVTVTVYVLSALAAAGVDPVIAPVVVLNAIPLGSAGEIA